VSFLEESFAVELESFVVVFDSVALLQAKMNPAIKSQMMIFFIKELFQ